jgi:UDP-N-acetyl-D-mannosaminuronate dehydrogenase
MKIAVVGLSYVGLPLSLQFARSCVNVLGIDVDPGKVELLNNGQSYIKHVEHSAIAELIGSGKFAASTDFSLSKRSKQSSFVCQRRSQETVSLTSRSFSKPDGRSRRISQKALW